MLVHVCERPVACPHSQQKAWPQRHSTRLQLLGRQRGRMGEGGRGVRRTRALGSSLSSTNKLPHYPPTHISTLTHPPFFSTGLLHLGQGLVLAFSQLLVSDPSCMRCSQSCSMSQVQGECCTSQQAKQNWWPHAQSTCSGGGGGGGAVRSSVPLARWAARIALCCALPTQAACSCNPHPDTTRMPRHQSPHSRHPPIPHTRASQCCSLERMAWPQWGTEGHHFTRLLSSTYDSAGVGLGGGGHPDVCLRKLFRGTGRAEGRGWGEWEHTGRHAARHTHTHRLEAASALQHWPPTHHPPT